MQTAFPTPEDDDAEDVAWGLTTGAALWRQGERYDAIVWLKRAVEAANDAGAAGRADQLNRAATDLIASLAVPPQASAPGLPKGPASPPAQQAAPPAKAPVPPKPPPPRIPTPPASRAVSAPAPVPPKPPPPPRARMATPPPIDRTLEPTPPRPPMPSVTTSAPTIEALTSAPEAAGIAVEDAERRDPPPPPTILPDIPSSMPTPAVPVSEIEAALISDAPPPPPSPVPEPTELGSPDDLPLEPRAIEAPAPIEGPPALVRALDGLALTREQKQALARTATIESLADEEDVSIACLALVLEGSGAVQAAVTDITAVAVKAGELLYARSSIPDTLSLRIVAEANPTVVALWDSSADDVIGAAPDLSRALKRSSDRMQAIAGFTMGPVGERLDEALRALAIDRLDVRVLEPNEVIAVAGQPVPGMVIVGVGVVELEGDNGESERLGPGDFLFAPQVLGGGAAPKTARAGAKGAIVLFGARAVAHELLVTCPPLLELFAGM